MRTSHRRDVEAIVAGSSRELVRSPFYRRGVSAERRVARLTTHVAGYANIQAPYPTTRSRAPAVSPELHNDSRRALTPRRIGFH